MNDLSYVDPRVGVPVTILLWLLVVVLDRRDRVAARRRARDQQLERELAAGGTNGGEDHPPQEREAYARADDPAKHYEEDHAVIAHARSVAVEAGARA